MGATRTVTVEALLGFGRDQSHTYHCCHSVSVPESACVDVVSSSGLPRASLDSPWSLGPLEGRRWPLGGIVPDLTIFTFETLQPTDVRPFPSHEAWPTVHGLHQFHLWRC